MRHENCLESRKYFIVALTAKNDQGSQNFDNFLLFRQETAENRR
jgi:hypothetical protein